MKKKSIWAFALIAMLTSLGRPAVAADAAFDPVEYVNPLMGTQSTFELSTGNTYPAIARPWGMNFWTPQTGKMGDGWAYVYTANKIRGFKQTHQPSPWINDYGQFAIMRLSALRSSTRINAPAGSRIKAKSPNRIITKSIWPSMT